MIFGRQQIEHAQRLVYAAMPPTPQYAWPLLRTRLGSEVWVKHENHNPVGAFKVRGRRRASRHGVRTALIGVVSAQAPAYLHSYREGRVVEAPVATVLADGMACRVPEPAALEIIRREAEDVVAVSDDEVAEAMSALFARVLSGARDCTR